MSAIHRLIDDAVGDFFEKIPQTNYICDHEQIEKFLASFERDAQQVEKEHSEEDSAESKKTYALLNFIRRQIAVDIREKIVQEGGLSKEAFLAIRNKVSDELSDERLKELAKKISTDSNQSQPTSDLEKAAAAALPDNATVMIIGEDFNFDGLRLVMGISTLFKRASINYALGYAQENNLTPQMFSTIIDKVLESELREDIRHDAMFCNKTQRKFHPYINNKVALENPDHWQNKSLLGIDKVLNKISIYHAIAFCDLSGVDISAAPDNVCDPFYEETQKKLDQSRIDGPHAKELHVINAFIDNLPHMPLEDKTPQRLEAAFMKTLRDNLSSQKYMSLTKEFSRREKQVLDERVQKGWAIPKGYSIAK